MRALRFACLQPVIRRRLRGKIASSDGSNGKFTFFEDRVMKIVTTGSARPSHCAVHVLAVAVDATSALVVVAQAGVAEKTMTMASRKVDKDAGKMTIKHGPSQTSIWPSMTMVFRVKDRAMLDQVKEGDKIRFAADRVDGAITVMELKPEMSYWPGESCKTKNIVRLVSETVAERDRSRQCDAWQAMPPIPVCGIDERTHSV